MYTNMLVPNITHGLKLMDGLAKVWALSQRLSNFDQKG